jgi:hypothetical protein
MGQVIEVQLINPQTHEQLTKGFAQTSVPYQKSDHTPAHREAIELVLEPWGLGHCTLGKIERIVDGERTPMGGGSGWCWRYAYLCILQDDELGERICLAVLFATYREVKNEPSQTVPH